MHRPSLNKQPSFRDLTIGIPTRWHLTNDRKKSILMTDLGSASDWLKQISFTLRPIRINTQIWVVKHFCSRFSDDISRGKPVVASRNVGCFLRLFSHGCLIKQYSLTRKGEEFVNIRGLPLIIFVLNLISFWRLNTGLSYTPRMWIRRGFWILIFNSFFFRMLPRPSIISLLISITTILRCSGSLYIALQTMKKEKD